MADSFEDYLSKHTMSSKGPEDVIKSRPANPREQVSDVVDYLRGFIPNRFYEYEMRLFDPKKAIPLESRSPYDPTYDRYSPRASQAIGSLENFSRTLPVHLKEFYQNLDMTKALEKISSERR